MSPEAPPSVEGDLDAHYLEAALKRAGIEAPVRRFETQILSGGRTGARVTAIQTGDPSPDDPSPGADQPGRYVLKVLPRDNWRVPAFGTPDAGEGLLWLHGATRTLVAPIVCPTIDVAVQRERDEWWVLMRDVSAGIRPRGAFDDDDERRLLDGLARMHAAHWGSHESLSAMPLPAASGPTTAFAEPVAHAAGRREASAPWVTAFVESFAPLAALLPEFLELLGPADADFYLQLTQQRDWHRHLDVATPTLLHGDLRRANVAFIDESVTLLDWEFAARGPAACDLQWHWFLHFWAYPPDRREPTRDDLRSYYLEALESALGASIDREEFDRTWDVAWLRALAQLGFCMVDSEGGRDLAARAVAHARRIADRYA